MSEADLHGAIRDAQRLLQHASQRGLQLPDEIVSDIIEAKALLDKSEADPQTFEQQKKFWISFRKLAGAVAPASMETIRYNALLVTPFWSEVWSKVVKRPAKQLAVGEAAVRRAGWIALVWLIIVGLCQWYVEVASTTLQIYATNKVIYEKSTRQLEQMEDNAKQTEAEIALTVETRRVEEQAKRQLLIMERLLPFTTFADAGNPSDRARQVLAATEFYLIVLRGFLLPAFWGLIGAALYVLRTLAQDLGNTSYSSDHATLHRSRY